MITTTNTTPRRRPGRPCRNASGERVTTRRTYLTPEAWEDLVAMVDAISSAAGHNVPTVHVLSTVVQEAWANHPANPVNQ